MVFVFFQRILSIHFAVFFKELSKNNEVYLFIEEKLSEERKKQGWALPDYGDTIIKLRHDYSEISDFILTKEKPYYVFSGIHNSNKYKKLFQFAIKNRRRVGLMSEPYNDLGLKGKLRFYRSWLHYIKYGRYVNFVLGIGNLGFNWYLRTGYKEEKIFTWAYFTKRKEEMEFVEKERGMFNLIFVGQLIERKRILELLEVVVGLKNTKIKVVGNGRLKEEVIKYQTNYPDKIEYMGVLANDKVLDLVASSDLLVLPSVFDGWGAIVNESIQVGTPVICTKNCGASVLLDGQIRGTSFKWSKNNLKVELVKWNNKLKVKSERNQIINWSDNISAKKGVKYFIDVIEYVENIKGDKPKAPWI
ncbi:glycosyltransferase family 4 protein [Tenacibaculum sp.]|uniref:glycosyltransferase family 4 protein n=1 Tax=Tenacibaculum sp. TaxID=1906242 RepID=UPI003AA9D72B